MTTTWTDLTPFAGHEGDAAGREELLRSRLSLGGVRVDRLSGDEVVDILRAQLRARGDRPLAVGSVNLDHIHHFGVRGRERGTIDTPDSPLEWLMLIDGSPVARHAREVTADDWPRLTGADLLPALLTLAEQTGARVGFLGGFEATIPALGRALRAGWPKLHVAGHWTPDRQVIDDAEESTLLAVEIARAHVDILIVGLGKPRQEKWIERFGATTGAPVLTAFGAAADFLAGSAQRAPEWMRQAGIEWMFRLGQEPRRLSRRYLLEGPIALWDLRRTLVSLDYSTAALSHDRVTAPSPSPRVREP
jgi:N-acetylglucosaminyldiphosphoundecaprenol N-acetyl-beta-D-mannosaminyltransferase